MLRQDCSFRRLKRRSKTKNFLSIFCRLPPHPPPRKIRKVRKIFGFCSRDRRERTRRASLVVRIQFKIHSNFVQYTPPERILQARVVPPPPPPPALAALLFFFFLILNIE